MIAYTWYPASASSAPAPHEGINVRGLNTAATLWGSAAVGAASAGFAAEALLASLFVRAGRQHAAAPVVNTINRAPIDDASTESPPDA